MIEIGRLSLDPYEQWSQFIFRNVNWYDFNFIKLYVENDVPLGDFEIEIALLGFGLRIVWSYDRNTEMRQEIKRRFAEISQLIEDNIHDDTPVLGPEAAPPDGGIHRAP